MTVYLEVDPEHVVLYVRDEGSGFVEAAVPPDRKGVSQSIRERMERHGGTADIDSAPGEGTEVELRMPRAPRRTPPHGRRRRRTRGLSPMDPITVYLVDDHRMFLTGVKAELDALQAGPAEAPIEVVGTASDVDGAIAGIRSLVPDVVLVDVHMPDGGGLAVIEGTKGADPDLADLRFLALSVSDAAEDVIGVIRAGARGYLTKTVQPAELATAIRRVRDGDAVFSPRLAGFVLDAFSHDLVGAVDPDLDQLTPREKEVLRYIARGYAYKQVAHRLHISVKTVETHVSAVLRKLQLSSRHELTRWASDRRLI